MYIQLQGLWYMVAFTITEHKLYVLMNGWRINFDDVESVDFE